MEDRLIYDVGLHLGWDAEFYLKKGFRVIGVEADPSLAERTASHLGDYVRSGQLTIVNKAIAASPGPISFFRSESFTEVGTIDAQWAERNARLGVAMSEIRVEAVQLSSLLETYGVPYYAKIDIEGADVLCLRQLLGHSERPKFISIESPKASFDELFVQFALLKELGYSRFNVVSQHKVPRQLLPFPAREGDYVKHEFCLGSSGPFGSELPGEWLSLEQAIRRYLQIFRIYRLTGDAGAVSAPVRQYLNSGAPTSQVIRMLKRVARPIGRRLKAGWYDTHATRGDED